MAMSAAETRGQRQWSTLLGATLEAFIHQLLFVRQVYPEESFVSFPFLGIHCHKNRNVQVCKYVSKSLQVIKPSIVSNVSNQVVLKILDKERVLEQFVLQVIASPVINEVDTDEQLNELKHAMRDLVLQIHSLGSRDLGILRGHDVFFKLGIMVIDKDNAADSTRCAEVSEAVSEGKWHYNNAEFEQANDQDAFLLRPLQRVSVPKHGLHFNLVMKIPNDKKPPS